MRVRNILLGLAASSMGIASGVANAASPLSLRAGEFVVAASQLQEDDDDDGGGSTAVILGVVLVVLIAAAAISGNGGEDPDSP